MKTTKIIISSVASTLIVSAIVYAATITGVGPQTINPGDTIGNGWFQQVNDQIAAAVPAGAVIAFNLTACPSGWIAANGASGTPDLRGEFVRGLDGGRGVDAGRTLATAQADMLRSHTHPLPSNLAIVFGPTTLYFSSGDTGGTAVSGPTGATGGAETRPRNVALLYCVRQ
jgi:hypothetical protein